MMRVMPLVIALLAVPILIQLFFNFSTRLAAPYPRRMCRGAFLAFVLFRWSDKPEPRPLSEGTR